MKIPQGKQNYNIEIKFKSKMSEIHHGCHFSLIKYSNETFSLDFEIQWKCLFVFSAHEIRAKKKRKEK